MKCNHPAPGEGEEITKNKSTMEIKKNYIHTPSKFSAFVGWHGCLTSSMSWLMFQASEHTTCSMQNFYPSVHQTT